MDRAEIEPGSDLRTPLLAACAWAGAVLGLLLPGRGVVILALLATAAVVVATRRRPGRVTAAACVLAGVAVALLAAVRVQGVTESPVSALARERAAVTVTGPVVSDPRLGSGAFGDYVTLRVRVARVEGRGASWSTDVPLLLIGEPSWRRVRLGSEVQVTGRLAPSKGPDLAAVLSAGGRPDVLRNPGPVWRAADRLRGGIREAVAERPSDQRALVPALVDGDDAGLDPVVAGEFRTAGLTHLLAVSGTNLTLIVGSLLVLARWCGVRARLLVLVGGLGVAGFVVLARAEPSVVRAAAMGSVALVGMGANGLRRGVRGLGVAVLGLLAFDPWLATSVGFALSVLATAGILFLAPGWRDALCRWLPRWLAEAVAVPCAAQLACTPLVAAISGQVSLVAVMANVVVAPVVGPATVAGVAGGLVALVSPALGSVCGTVAGWSAGWILLTAHVAASAPGAAVDWSTAPWSVAALVVLCLLLAATAGHLVARRGLALAVACLGLLVVLVPMPSPGWPPREWVMVACDVGQGDGLVLNAGHGSALVVDTGPDPALMHACLDRLGVRTVPLVILTHFHADHVGGLAGVLEGHPVGEIDVTSFAEPAAGASAVHLLADAAGVPVRVPAYAEQRHLGPLTWQVVGPTGRSAGGGGGDGSGPNNASLVVVIRTRGVRLLLAGDVEPEAQAELARALPGLRVDVLKVPHHGSRYQDGDFLTSLGARLAVISVGADNDYGHPAPETVASLERAGMTVERTDLDGAVAVVVRDGRVGVVTFDGGG